MGLNGVGKSSVNGGPTLNEGAPNVGNGVSTEEASRGETGAKVNDVEAILGTDFHQIHSKDAIENDFFGQGDFGLGFGSKMLACATCCA